MLRQLPELSGAGTARRVRPLIDAARVRGWTPDQLRRELRRDMTGVRNIAAVMVTRLRTLGDPPPTLPEPGCPDHPGAARRGASGECAGCWADRIG